jgi:ABC-type glycerol-3-phosphate transport system permease component
VARRLVVAGRWGGVLLLLGAFLFPLYWIVTTAFKPEGEWESYGGKTFWVPERWTLDNFRGVLGRPPTSQFLDVTTSQSAWPAIETA